MLQQELLFCWNKLVWGKGKIIIPINCLEEVLNYIKIKEQQRVTIARALSNNPKILLLDEPTGDLDTKNSDLILNIIMGLNLKEGRTIVMVTHDTNLKNFATRTVRMLDGKIAHIEVIINKSKGKLNGK